MFELGEKVYYKTKKLICYICDIHEYDGVLVYVLESDTPHIELYNCKGDEIEKIK